MPLAKVHGLHRDKRSHYSCRPIAEVLGELDLTYIK